ncbi:MAG: hypothetical protein WAN36_00545 [Calditrichia bacterium]
MNKLNKSQKRMMLILMLALCYAVYEGVTNWETYAGFYSSKKPVVQGKVINSGKLAATDQATVSPEYNLGWGSDPFYEKPKDKPLVKKVKSSPQIYLNLQAISYTGPGSVVMINDRILKVGEYISGYRVKSIDPQRVVLSGKNGSKILTLK